MHTTAYKSSDPIARRLLRIAGVIYMVLGVGHLVILTVTSRAVIAGWFDSGLVGAVPLGLTVASSDVLRSSVAFWAGIASFAVPLFLLGLLFWRLATLGVRMPPVVGWVLTIWCLLSALIITPSPFYLGIVAGVLVIVATTRARATAAA